MRKFIRAIKHAIFSVSTTFSTDTFRTDIFPTVIFSAPSYAGGCIGFYHSLIVLLYWKYENFSHYISNIFAQCDLMTICSHIVTQYVKIENIFTHCDQVLQISIRTLWSTKKMCSQIVTQWKCVRTLWPKLEKTDFVFAQCDLKLYSHNVTTLEIRTLYRYQSDLGNK